MERNWICKSPVGITREVRGRGHRCTLTVRTVPSDVVNFFGHADKATSLQ